MYNMRNTCILYNKFSYYTFFNFTMSTYKLYKIKQIIKSN